MKRTNGNRRQGAKYYLAAITKWPSSRDLPGVKTEALGVGGRTEQHLPTLVWPIISVVGCKVAKNTWIFKVGIFPWELTGINMEKME